MTDQGPVVPQAALLDEARAYALVGGAAATDRFTFGGASVVIGPAGTLIITEAGDSPDRSGVWNAEEIRLLGPAPGPVTRRLTGHIPKWWNELADMGVTLLRSARKGEQERPGAHLFKPLRQVIESTNETFKGQLDLERHHARTPAEWPPASCSAYSR
jgi:hypothetical protein